MKKGLFNIDRINEIIQNTIDVIDKSRGELFDIAESTRRECKLIEDELAQVKQQTSEIIKQVDALEASEKESRQKLMEVSQNIKDHTEQDVRIAYEKARDLQVQSMIKKAEEQQLIQKRSELERRLRMVSETTAKAESLVSRVGIAMGYLSGGLQDLYIQLEDIKQKQFLGIKIIKAQEEERKRVAREIHDGPAQLMANLVIKTELCEKLVDMDTEKAKLELDNLRETARCSLRDIRKIIYDLRPMSLDDLGLIPTVQRFIANYIEETRVNVEFLVLGEARELKPIIELAIFRLIQEALNNVKKHAFSKLVNVKIEFMQDFINIIVNDDGRGFDRDNLVIQGENCGYGLLSMRERVELLNGKFELKSNIGKGTRIFVNIPLQINEE